MKKVCVQCGKEFEITEGEISVYKEKDLQIPKRCRQCRKSNRIRKNDVVVKKPKRRGLLRGFRAGEGGPRPGMIMILVVLAIVINGLFRGNIGSEKTPGSGSRITTGSEATGTGITVQETTLIFRDWSRLEEHYEKHGKAMGYSREEDYLAGANTVVADPKALHKKEKEDGDDIYFLEKTGELVVVSTDGYIRTYFQPEDGIAYYNRQ